MSISKLLLDNIDTLNGIAKGRKWQWREENSKWYENDKHCPIFKLVDGHLIRLAPETKWVDFSQVPDKRPNGYVFIGRKKGSGLQKAVFDYGEQSWLVGGINIFMSDARIFTEYDWHHEDGTVTPFGVEVEG